MKKKIKLNRYLVEKLDRKIQDIVTPKDRLDAEASFGLARDLVQIFTTTVLQAYRESKAYKFIPFMSDSLQEGVRSFEYNVVESFGSAILMERLEGDNIPVTNATSRTESQKVLNAVAGYKFTEAELISILARKRNRQTYFDLIEQKRTIAVAVLLDMIDKVHAYGDLPSGSYGLANNPNVDIIAVPNGDWLNPATTVQEIEADFLFMENAMRQKVDNLTSLLPNIIVFPEEIRSRLLGRMNPAGDSEATILNMFSRKATSITNIDFWDKLNDVPDTVFGPVDRTIIYRYDPIVAGVPPTSGTPTFKTPQEKGFDYSVILHQPVTGVVMQMPVAVGYVDNIL